MLYASKCLAVNKEMEQKMSNEFKKNNKIYLVNINLKN